MNLDNYRSFGSYSPLYTEPLRRLYECFPPDRARQAESVLRAYAEHANAIGTCYPGMRVIMKRTHYSETTYKRALNMLAELDYMRLHREYSPSRRKPLDTMQISPYVLHIGRDHISEAILLWNTTELRCNVIIHEQPESESESEPKTEPESATRIRTTTTTRTERLLNAQNPASANRAKTSQISQQQTEGLNQQTEGQKTKQRTVQRDSQRESAKTERQKSVPPAPPISECRAPLIDPREEQVALDIVTKLNTRIAQARQLVRQFGADAVETGLAWWELENQKRNVGFGLLKWWLADKVVTADPADKPQKPKESGMFGQYADMFGGD